jgi:hypothetical protein
MLESVFKSAQLSLTFLFLFGMGLEMLDYQPWWRATYRWVHDFFHSAKNAMPKDKARGVFYNQPSKAKWTRVGLASTLLFVISIWEHKLDVNLAAEVIVWVLGFPATLVGMFIGYQAMERLFPNRDKVFSWADRTSQTIEKVSISDAAGAVKSLGTKVAGELGSKFSSALHGTEPQVVPPPPAASPPPAETPEDVLKRFTQGR